MKASYHVPKHIQEHIDYITPGIRLVALTKRGRSKRGFGMTSGQNGHGASSPPKWYPGPMQQLNNLSTCDIAITPACIRALYSVPEVSPDAKVDSSNSLGIYEEGDYYAQEDLDLFFANIAPYIPQWTHPIPAFIDGAQAPVPVTDAGGESDLDFELAYPLIYPQTITLYQTDDFNYATNPNSTATGSFNTFLDALDGVSI